MPSEPIGNPRQFPHRPDFFSGFQIVTHDAQRAADDDLRFAVLLPDNRCGVTPRKIIAIDAPHQLSVGFIKDHQGGINIVILIENHVVSVQNRGTAGAKGIAERPEWFMPQRFAIFIVSE